MAFAEHSPLTPHRRDLCSRSIWLARKIRSDLTALTESYVKHQGLNENINLDSVDGVPVASTDQWSELTEAERLQENLQAYRTFHVLLARLLEDQQVHFTPTKARRSQRGSAICPGIPARKWQNETYSPWIPPLHFPASPSKQPHFRKHVQPRNV
ncbi:PREDICTED: ciliary neurotrophic factor isoform X2 [Cercocebus atys]|uniref:ciliary neurotrophic factor isoform X2 n=1 Tax=Cercocebus atys TaxID=9531 RepID=UPI0005F42630|nr:ciliary neurotrophic factor isoform X5 [Macaca nemestrina]XP_011947651.1 PREDICTED: ciliary neurotrophic factor isoform X2 [Cercocebus atys]